METDAADAAEEAGSSTKIRIQSAAAAGISGGSDTDPTKQNRANYDTATYDFSSTIAAITELGAANTSSPHEGTETNGPISILKTEIVPVPGLANNIGGNTQKYFAHLLVRWPCNLSNGNNRDSDYFMKQNVRLFLGGEEKLRLL